MLLLTIGLPPAAGSWAAPGALLNEEKVISGECRNHVI
jgi:hypothetical protein